MQNHTQTSYFCHSSAEISQLVTFPPGGIEAGGVLHLSALAAGASSGSDPAGLPKGPGAAAAARGAPPHAHDCAGVRPSGRSGCTAAGGAGEEGQTHQQLGVCLLCGRGKRDGCVSEAWRELLECVWGGDTT